MKLKPKGPQQREKDNFGFQKSWIREENKSNIKTEEEEKKTIQKCQRRNYPGQQKNPHQKQYETYGQWQQGKSSETFIGD